MHMHMHTHTQTLSHHRREENKSRSREQKTAGECQQPAMKNRHGVVCRSWLGRAVGIMEERIMSISARHYKHAAMYGQCVCWGGDLPYR